MTPSRQRGHVSEQVNNADRPINHQAAAFRGNDGLAASAEAAFAEPRYRMSLDLGGNVECMANVDRRAAYQATRNGILGGERVREREKSEHGEEGDGARGDAHG